MAKKGILVNIDPGNTPLVFIVPGEAVTHEQEEKLERLIELYFSMEFEFVDVHEVANLKDLHDMVIEDHGEDGKSYPSFDEPVSEEDGAKLMGVSVARYREHTARQEAKIRDFGGKYGELNISGVTSGRTSSKDVHLSNLPKSGPKGYSMSGRLVDDHEPRLQNISPLAKKKYEPPRITSEYYDYGAMEKRILGFSIGRFSCETPNIQELPKTLKTPNGKEIKRTWDPCCEGCLGWVHMGEPYEIEACDVCSRFKKEDGEFLDEQARKAHKEECGCGWPDFDVQNACVAWVGCMGPESNDPKSGMDVQELSNLLDVRGVEFMDNVVPAIYVCSRILEKAAKGGGNSINGQGLMRLLKGTQEKIHNEELKLKDFGSPPGAKEEEKLCPDCGKELDENGKCPLPTRED